MRGSSEGPRGSFPFFSRLSTRCVLCPLLFISVSLSLSSYPCERCFSHRGRQELVIICSRPNCTDSAVVRLMTACTPSLLDYLIKINTVVEWEKGHTVLRYPLFLSLELPLKGGSTRYSKNGSGCGLDGKVKNKNTTDSWYLTTKLSKYTHRNRCERKV